MIAPLSALALSVAAPLALDGTVTAETGAEYDSNANRAVAYAAPPAPMNGAAPPTPVGSPLWRLQVGGRLRHAAGRHRLRLSLDLGGKVFFLREARSQDIGVVMLGVEEGGALGRLRLSVFANYFDAYQRGGAAPAPDQVDATQRDFRLGELGLRLGAGRGLAGALQSIDGGVDVLGQLFQFKPDNAYTYLAPSLQPRLSLRWHRGDPELGQDFDLTVAGRFDYRRYPLDGRGTGRDDIFLQGGATFGFSGPLVAQLGYQLQENLSTLVQESYQRHVVLAKVAVRVPLDVYLTCKGQLNLFQSSRPPAVGQPPQPIIEDDNRSLVLLDLSRPLPRGFAALARYAFYFTASGLGGTELSYQRHTVFLGLSYRLRVSR